MRLFVHVGIYSDVVHLRFTEDENLIEISDSSATSTYELQPIFKRVGMPKPITTYDGITMSICKDTIKFKVKNVYVRQCKVPSQFESWTQYCLQGNKVYVLCNQEPHLRVFE